MKDGKNKKNNPDKYLDGNARIFGNGIQRLPSESVQLSSRSKCGLCFKWYKGTQTEHFKAGCTMGMKK